MKTGGFTLRMTGLAAGFLVMMTAWTVREAGASGFALREYSVTAQGNAFAGATAAAEDISYMAFNPAGLTLHKGSEAVLGTSWIAPQAKFSKDSATTVRGTAIDGTNGGDDGAPNALVPAFYAAGDVSSRLLGDLRLGLAMFVPFGLETSYEPGWVGRYHALDSEIISYNVNPVVAWRATDRLSVGAGIQIAYNRARLSSANDFGTLDVVRFSNAYGGTPLADDGTSESDGDDIAFGFNFGLLYELRAGSRIGFAFRSALHSDLEGTATFNNGTVGDAIANATGAFVDTGVTAEMNLPETISAGFYHDVSAQWSVMGEVSWTNWSRINELRLQFDNSAQSDSVIATNWNDSIFLALGATWRSSPTTTWRFGVAWDQSPVPDSTRTPRVPDEDRYWLSVGLDHELASGVHIAGAYTHLFVPDAKVNLTTADTNNTFRGNLRGTFENSADILSLQVAVRF